MGRYRKNSEVLEEIHTLPEYQAVLADIKARKVLPGLALPRSARLPILAALNADLQAPIFLLTTRADQALTLADELKFWAPEITRLVFPEPNPLFYEQAAWVISTRRDRL